MVKAFDTVQRNNPTRPPGNYLKPATKRSYKTTTTVNTKNARCASMMIMQIQLSLPKSIFWTTVGRKGYQDSLLWVLLAGLLNGVLTAGLQHLEEGLGVPAQGSPACEQEEVQGAVLVLVSQLKGGLPHTAARVVLTAHRAVPAQKDRGQK